MEDYKFLFKVVLVGNAGVGKTCLVRRFTQGLFPPGQGATIGVDFMIKTVEVDGEKVKLQIWDTAGQERFRSITQSYYRSAHALILVYDISCQPTFDCLPDWLREIEEYASTKVLRILVGNKTDREDREIPRHIGEEFAARHGMYFLETSAKEAENVERLFMEIAVELMDVAAYVRRNMDGYRQLVAEREAEARSARAARLKSRGVVVRTLAMFKQAKSKDLPKYEGNLGSINGKTTSVGDGSCCSR